MKIVISRQTGPEEATVFEIERDTLEIPKDIEAWMDDVYRVIDKRVLTVNQRIIKAKELLKNLVEEYPDEPGKVKRAKGSELLMKFNALVSELFGILNTGVQYTPPRKEIV